MKDHKKAKHTPMELQISLYCNECNYTTTKKVNLAKHRKRNHPSNGFHCNECKFKTSIGKNLERHYMKHVLNESKGCI